MPAISFQKTKRAPIDWSQFHLTEWSEDIILTDAGYSASDQKMLCLFKKARELSELPETFLVDSSVSKPHPACIQSQDERARQRGFVRDAMEHMINYQEIVFHDAIYFHALECEGDLGSMPMHDVLEKRLWWHDANLFNGDPGMAALFISFRGDCIGEVQQQLLPTEARAGFDYKHEPVPKATESASPKTLVGCSQPKEITTSNLQSNPSSHQGGLGAVASRGGRVPTSPAKKAGAKLAEGGLLMAALHHNFGETPDVSSYLSSPDSTTSPQGTLKRSSTAPHDLRPPQRIRVTK